MQLRQHVVLYKGTTQDAWRAFGTRVAVYRRCLQAFQHPTHSALVRADPLHSAVFCGPRLALKAEVWFADRSGQG